jgi:hypothetical protein
VNDRSARVFASARKERSADAPAAKEAKAFWSKAPIDHAEIRGERP